MIQRRTFHWQEYYIYGTPNSGPWYPKFFKKIRITWLDQYYSFTCFVKLPLCVSLALNRCKVDIISDPYQYLFLIVGFFQRGVPLFSYGFECCFYKKDVPIGEIVSCCSCVGGECSMDCRNTALKRSSWLMVTMKWKWNWRVFGRPQWGNSMTIIIKSDDMCGWGRLEWWKTLERSEECPYY